MALDLTRIQALCFDVDGTIADTDDHLVAQLALLLDKVPGVGGRRGEKMARQVVMGLETPVHGAYAWLDRLGLDVPAQRLRQRLRAMKARQADPAHTRNPEAIDEVPHDMVAGVQEMLHKSGRPLSHVHHQHGRRTAGGNASGALWRARPVPPRGGLADHPRMKPHPEPLLYARRRWVSTRRPA